MAEVKISEFPLQENITDVNATVTGLHDGQNVNFKVSDIGGMVDISGKTDKGGYTGTAQDLKDLIDTKADSGGSTSTLLKVETDLNNLNITISQNFNNIDTEIFNINSTLADKLNTGGYGGTAQDLENLANSKLSAEADTLNSVVARGGTTSLDVTVGSLTAQNASLNSIASWDGFKKLVSATITELTSFLNLTNPKSTPVDNDTLILQNSASANQASNVTLANFWTNYISPKIGSSYVAKGTLNTNFLTKWNGSALVDSPIQDYVGGFVALTGEPARIRINRRDFFVDYTGGNTTEATQFYLTRDGKPRINLFGGITSDNTGFRVYTNDYFHNIYNIDGNGDSTNVTRFELNSVAGYTTMYQTKADSFMYIGKLNTGGTYTRLFFSNSVNNELGFDIKNVRAVNFLSGNISASFLNSIRIGNNADNTITAGTGAIRFNKSLEVSDGVGATAEYWNTLIGRQVTAYSFTNSTVITTSPLVLNSFAVAVKGVNDITLSTLRAGSVIKFEYIGVVSANIGNGNRTINVKLGTVTVMSFTCTGGASNFSAGDFLTISGKIVLDSASSAKGNLFINWGSGKTSYFTALTTAINISAFTSGALNLEFVNASAETATMLGSTFHVEIIK